MNTVVKGLKGAIDPSKKHKYGYGMHSDFIAKQRHTPTDLVDPTQIIDPDLRDIKRSLKLDSERFSE